MDDLTYRPLTMSATDETRRGHLFEECRRLCKIYLGQGKRIAPQPSGYALGAQKAIPSGRG